MATHNSRRIRDALNELHTNRWIERGGLGLWPARSTDLTPLDSFPRGALKNVVYQEMPTTLENMRQWVTAAYAGQIPRMIKDARILTIQ